MHRMPCWCIMLGFETCKCMWPTGSLDAVVIVSPWLRLDLELQPGPEAQISKRVER